MGQTTIKAEIAGRICALQCQVGATVQQGDDIVIIEAMKMEIPAPSPVAGRIKAILVSVGDMITEGQPLAVIEI
jgi:biotin carboxyl carrier protein